MQYYQAFLVFLFLSSEKIYTHAYKEYAAYISNFGNMSHALRWCRKSKWLGEFRTGKPANSPVGAISRRRRSLNKTDAVFYFSAEIIRSSALPAKRHTVTFGEAQQR